MKKLNASDASTLTLLAQVPDHLASWRARLQQRLVTPDGQAIGAALVKGSSAKVSRGAHGTAEAFRRWSG